MRITKRLIEQWEQEILAGARPGATMNEADPLGVMIQKKIATWREGQK